MYLGANDYNNLYGNFVVNDRQITFIEFMKKEGFVECWNQSLQSDGFSSGQGRLARFFMNSQEWLDYQIDNMEQQYELSLKQYFSKININMFEKYVASLYKNRWHLKDIDYQQKLLKDIVKYNFDIDDELYEQLYWNIEVLVGKIAGYKQKLENDSKGISEIELLIDKIKLVFHKVDCKVKRDFTVFERNLKITDNIRNYFYDLLRVELDDQTVKYIEEMFIGNAGQLDLESMYQYFNKYEIYDVQIQKRFNSSKSEVSLVQQTIKKGQKSGTVDKKQLIDCL